jgi:dienelactone hydrolase
MVPSTKMESLMSRFSLFALSAVAMLASSVTAQPVMTAPLDLTQPDIEPIRLSGLQPQQIIVIETIRRSDWRPEALVARAEFKADASGRIDAGAQAPISGTYSGIDPLGLFWSAGTRTIQSDDPKGADVRILARVDGKVIASITAQSLPDAAQIVTEQVANFPGAIFSRPRTPGKHPAIIVLGGSEGGASTAREYAPIFAAQGYAVLGLPYYDAGYDPANKIAGLPTSFTEISVDQLTEARNWLSKQSTVDISRIGVWGVSKGAEFAAIAATRFDWITAVVAVVPSDVVWEGWGKAGPATSSFAFGGKVLPFVPYLGVELELARARRGEIMEMARPHAAGRAANPERVAAARIPIENYRGSLLVIGGLDDRVWPSGEMALAMADTRAKAGLATVKLVYENVGHTLAGPGTKPSIGYAIVGGKPSAIAKARAEAWRATFAFLKNTLGKQ